MLARKDTFSYRASKFVNRNKLGVAAAALVLLLLVGGIVATAWQARRATAQARIAASERDRAERRFNDVCKLSNSLLFEIAPKIERLEGSIKAREKLVERALEYLNSLAREAGDDLQLQSELASAYEKVGNLHATTGITKRACRIRPQVPRRDYRQRQGLATNKHERTRMETDLIQSP